MAFLRNVCFTVNNYTVEDLCTLADAAPAFAYLVVGYETGETGTPHLQGYGELLRQTRFSTVQKYLPRGWIAARKGTAEQAKAYCLKGGYYTCYGVQKRQGNRTDLCKVRTIAIEEGLRAVTGQFNFQAIRVAEKFLTYNEEPRDWKPTVAWLWGPTGTGKSRVAREIVGTDDYFTKSDGTKWWDGYDGHEAVIIDDFRDSWWPLTYTLGLLDRYEFKVEYKGGYRQFKPRTIVVTSCAGPAQMYRGTGEAVEQLLRRVDVIEHFPAEVSLVSEVRGVIIKPPDYTLEDLEALFQS